MTTAMLAVGATNDRSALRVAIARAGRIEREWVIERGAVTIGRSHDADVFVADHTSKLDALVRIDDDDMTLVVPHGATGRVQLASGAKDLATLAGSSIVLDASARGRLLVGGASVLFQRVAPPIKRAKPELPASVRGGILARVDGLFTALVAASFMLHMGVVAMLSEHDWPAPPSLAVVDDRVADLIFQDPTPPPDPTTSDPTDPTPQDHPTDPTPSHPSDPSPAHPHPSHGDHPAPSRVDDPAIVAQQIDTAVQMLIGADGIGGAVQNLIANGAPTTSSAQILSGVATVTPATAQTPAMRTGRGSDLPPGTFGLHTTELSERHGGEPLTEDAPRPPHITIEPPDEPIAPSGDFDDQMLVRALRGRMPQIRACYEHELTGTPTLAGRVSVAMQVERVGILSHVAIDEDTVGSDRLDACVVRVVSGIRLPAGPSEPVSVTYPIVFAPQT